MIALEEALATYRRLPALASCRLPLADALGHVLTEPVPSAVDLPMFTQSAVDGYALRSADLAGAHPDAPVRLELIGEIAAGAPSSIVIGPGQAVRIFTGGAMPASADTTARQEIVERDGPYITLRQPVRPGADTRYLGEEIRQGDCLGATGQRLHSGLLAALAMAGVGAVNVKPKPRVALIVSGDEVAAAGQPLKPGEIHDANGPLIKAWLRERGYPLVLSHRVGDNRGDLLEAMRESFEHADVVLSSGGVSVGDRDYIPGVAQELGVRKLFWNVAQKPGKPLWFGLHASGKPLLGFPGNPAAVLIGLHLHAARLFGALEGLDEASMAWRHGLLTAEVRCDTQRDQLVRVAVGTSDGGINFLQPLKRQDSHMLSNLAAADGLAWIRRGGGPLPKGTVVLWQPL